MSRLPSVYPLPITPLLVTVVPQKQSIAVEQMGNYVLTLHNQGKQKVAFIVYLEGVNQHWFIISPPHLTLQEGDSATIVVTITPPRLSACQAGDYPLRFILCSTEDTAPSWRYVLEADLTIEPFDLLLEPELAHTQRAHGNNHTTSKTKGLQRLLLIPLLLFSCILISTFTSISFRAWAIENQKFKDSFGSALLEPTQEASRQSELLLSLKKPEHFLDNSSDALKESVFIAPNWSAPLSSPTPFPPITFIPSPTATSTHPSPPTASPQSTPSAIPTSPPFLPTATQAYPKGTLSPTVPIAKADAVASPTYAPSPTEPPINTATTEPPESDSGLFASMPTSLMIEPEITDTSSISTSLTYEQMFRQIGAQYAIDWRLLASVAYQESSLEPLAVGKDGDMGLMQIIEPTWDEFAPEVGVSEPFDPYSNVQVGAAYLNYLRGYLVSQGYSEEYWTLVAYNWGPQNMRNLMEQGGNWGDVPASRQNYAYKIIKTVNNINLSNEYNNDFLESKLKKYISGTP